MTELKRPCGHNLGEWCACVKYRRLDEVDHAHPVAGGRPHTRQAVWNWLRRRGSGR